MLADATMLSIAAIVSGCTDNDRWYHPQTTNYADCGQTVRYGFGDTKSFAPTDEGEGRIGIRREGAAENHHYDDFTLLRCENGAAVLVSQQWDEDPSSAKASLFQWVERQRAAGAMSNPVDLYGSAVKRGYGARAFLTGRGQSVAECGCKAFYPDLARNWVRTGDGEGVDRIDEAASTAIGGGLAL